VDQPPPSLNTPHGEIALPAFLPDATRGVVQSVDAHDLRQCGVRTLQMNVFHLMQKPGSSTIHALGGLHRMSGWEGPITTDSGGFQVYSLIRQNPGRGTLTDRGAIFRAEGSDRRFRLTPEKSIQLQFSYGSDVLFCLDDCTHVDAPSDEQLASVSRTIRWAKRAKAEFRRLVERGAGRGHVPRLFAIVQGGGLRDLRQRCAEALLEIEFDGYGYGGWPLNHEGNLLEDIFGYVRDLIPLEFPLHALGVGHPAYVKRSFELGYRLFDSTMPTRDARHGRLYVFAVDPATSALAGEWFGYVHIADKKYIKQSTPLSPFCDCACCAAYSAGYLHHLFKLRDPLYPRLATIHNLRFTSQLMSALGRQRQVAP
jgi:queuine tRNA-ribosyltransferase